MKTRIRRTRNELQSQLQSMICMAHKEVQRHRRLISQKCGMDVNWDFAERDWLQRQFPNWKRLHWNRALAESMESDSAETKEGEEQVVLL
jgi:hypothetical protein